LSVASSLSSDLASCRAAGRKPQRMSSIVCACLGSNWARLQACLSPTIDGGGSEGGHRFKRAHVYV
jgi:hypothetical protein